jgi:ABC-2 type transport system permease protein
LTQPETVVSANKVPGSMAQVVVTMKYTFRDYLRSRRFVILLFIGLLISALLTFVVAYFRPAGILDKPLDFYATWWGSTSSLIVVLSGVFFGGDAISGEFQNKTGYFTIPNPIRRSSIYVGKFLAAFIASSIILVIFAAISVGNGLYYFGANVPYQFGESFLFAWFYLLAVVGFTFFFSSLFKSSAFSILVSVILLLVAFGIIQDVVSSLAGIEPWFILTYGSGIIGNVLTVPYPTVPAGGRFAITPYVVTIPEGLVIIGAYFIVTAALGLLLFERKEFN